MTVFFLGYESFNCNSCSLSAIIRELCLLGCTSFHHAHTIVLFVVILHCYRVEALLQPRSNFEFLAKYFQGAYFLSLNQGLYCYIFY